MSLFSNRLNKISNQLSFKRKSVKPNFKNLDDIVIVSCKRTAQTRSRKGGFKDTKAADLLAPVFKAVTKKIDSKLVQEIVVGTVLSIGSHRHVECRQACFLAGFSKASTVRTVNRQCSSGLQAIADVASDILAGYYEIGIAAGVETMTADEKNFRLPPPIAESTKINKFARESLIPMGITSENVASKYGITRQQQDELAVLSHQRAAAAKKKFENEIIPIKTIFRDPKTNKEKSIIVRHDDGVRKNSNMVDLGRLKAVFKKDGSTTAGNSSQVSDGAAAALLMKRSKAEELGLIPMATFRNFAVTGVDPAIMGIGPTTAIPKVCQMSGIKPTNIDLYEINEAFASQATYCVKKLGLKMDNVNVNGGAIALGHPLGCTGTRMTVTLLHEMIRRKVKTGIVSMCVGTGMGAAAIFERN